MRRPPEDRAFDRFRRTRDGRALAAAFDATAPALLRVAVHLTGRTADAEDLVQQTFLVAIERGEKWDPSRGLFPWLAGILANEARLQRRAEARTVDPARLAAREEPPPPAVAEGREL